jgi:hypothetical protein
VVRVWDSSSFGKNGGPGDQKGWQSMIIAGRGAGLAWVGTGILSTGGLSPWKPILVLAVVLVVLISVVALSRAHRNHETATGDPAGGARAGDARVIGRYPPLPGETPLATARTIRDSAHLVRDAGSIAGDSAPPRVRGSGA